MDNLNHTESPVSWHKVSIEADGELAEAIADVFSRFSGESNIVIESTAIDTSDPDSPGQATGPLRVSLYLSIDDNLEQNLQKLEESLWYLSRIQPIPTATHTIIQEANWMEAWKQHYHPISVGEKLLILPVWMESSDPQRIPVLIDPGMAFGTGTHPTTQISMALLEKYIQEGENIIDVGSGSGILSIAAIKLGCHYALGVDVETQAKPLADKNALENKVTSQVEFHQGSIQDILSGKYTLQKAPLLVANILTPILINLFEAGMGDLLEPDGRIILSGILEEKGEEILACVAPLGFEVVERQQKEDWLGFVLRRK